MRIKSYFAASVQNAIGLARKEFGDDITLVTSHAASLESRHLGEYEIVFAVEEPAAVAEQHAPAQSIEFKQVLDKAVAATQAPVADVPAKVDRIRSLLIELGIDVAMVRALMTMIQRCAGTAACEGAEHSSLAEREMLPREKVEPDTSAVVVEEVDPVIAAANSQFTAAQLAFFRSVTVGGES